MLKLCNTRTVVALSTRKVMDEFAPKKRATAPVAPPWPTNAPADKVMVELLAAGELARGRETVKVLPM